MSKRISHQLQTSIQIFERYQNMKGNEGTDKGLPAAEMCFANQRFFILFGEGLKIVWARLPVGVGGWWYVE